MPVQNFSAIIIDSVHPRDALLAMNILRILFPDPQSLFEKEYAREILKSERLRGLLVMSLFLGTSLWMQGVYLSLLRHFPVEISKPFMGVPFMEWMSLACLAAAGYELIFILSITFFINRRMAFPPIPRIVNSIIEASFPTLLLWASSHTFSSAESLQMPVVLLYFFFIALSALRLNVGLCVLTGSVASAGYLAVAFSLIGGIPDATTGSIAASGIHSVKGLIIFLTGLLTGFVARQIRKRLASSLKSREDRARVVGIFGQHASPEVVETLLASAEEIVSDEREVCVMFLDIRNFTGYSEGRSPEEVVGHLNGLFTFMIDIVNARHGIINKFLGDGFMAIFGAPLSFGTDEDMRHAVGASLDICRRLDDEITAGRVTPTRIGLGLHAGPVMTGTIGSPLRREYTVIGDTVNLASRIEGLNKQLGTTVLASARVMAAARDLVPEAADLGEVEVRGHGSPVRLYRIR